MNIKAGVWIVVFSVGVCLSSAAEKTAEAAWSQLVANFSGRAAFAYVENDTSLPNVLIYGDSISIGYTPGVREALAGRANVYRIHLNGGPSGSFVGKFNTLETTMRNPELAGYWAFDWDVIHFNVGLHDLKYVNEANKLDLENGTQVATIKEYRANLYRIITCLKEAAPRAKLVFALTTKVPPESNGRFEDSELAYNQAALAVLQDYPEITINDLRTASLPFEQPGNVHFEPVGITAQAKHVAMVLVDELP